MSEQKSKRVRIGLDFDDTLMPTREAMLALLNAEHGTSIGLEECTETAFTNRWNFTRQDYIAFFTRHEEKIHEQGPFEGMIETLSAWSDQADFYVITGRPEAWKKSAERWLERYRIQVRDVICAEAGHGKAASVKEHQISFFIDDRPDFVSDMAEAGVPVILLDRPYNRGFTHRMVDRVSDWHEIRALWRNAIFWLNVVHKVV